MENFDWLDHNVSNDEKPAYVRRLVESFTEHMPGFLRWLIDTHGYDAHSVVHVIEYPWRYIDEFKAFMSANTAPSKPYWLHQATED